MARVLQGLRVLEHGTVVTGPAAAMLLGDPFRAFRGGSCSPHDQTCNRSKKCVRLDTRQPGDRGRWIALHMSSPPRFRQGLAQAIDKPDRFDDARFATREARIAHHEELIQTLGSIFATRSREDWCQRLQALVVPHAPVHDTDEVPEDPQARHLQLFVDTDHPAGGRWRSVRTPVGFDGERETSLIAPPLLGDHDAVLRSGRSLWSPRP